MADQNVTRKLVAIVSTDMVGYSRLIEVDEEGTLARQKAHRRELIDPKIAEHHGRIVKSTGDGLLIEFASAVDAVRCSVEVQRAMAEREADVAEDCRIQYRVGVNLGDIVIDSDDIFGDGVNIAARLQEIAEPGGVSISGTAYDQLKAKVKVGYEYLGEQQVKNISEPVRVYRALLDPEAVGTIVGVTRSGRRTWMVAAAAAALAALVVAGGLAWWPSADDKTKPPDKPSIAVLRFDNMSEDKAQDYFADGMAEDIITDLSKLSGLFVIARNSSFQYQGTKKDVKRIARELGVRYVLEGSVRRAKDTIRVNAQLIDTQTGGHIWAERYDGTLDDVFALQDRLTASIVAALAVNLTPREKAEQGRAESDNTEAYDAFLRGWAHYRRSTPEDFAKAVPYFDKAIALDPNYSRAYAALAALYSAVADKNRSTGSSIWSLTLGITMEEGLRREREYLRQAMKDPVPLAHLVSSRRLTRQGQHDAAITEAEQAILSDPNEPLAHEAIGSALVYAGNPSDAVGHLRQAMRLDPGFADDYLFLLGLAQLGTEQYAAAAETLTKAAQSHPDDDRSLMVLAAAYGHLGKIDAAKLAIEKANRIRSDQKKNLPKSGVQIGIDVLLIGPYTLQDVDFWPFREKTDRERLREGLRLAGVPEAGKGEQVSPLEVPGATTVDPAAAKRLFDDGVTFVDVRTPTLWANGHIPGAVFLDLKTMLTEASLAEVVGKDQEVVFYCMGPRCLVSSRACAKAVAWGYQKVYYLRQGYPGWKAAGFLVVIP